METKLNFITELAKQDKKLKIYNLIYLLSEKNLAKCFYELKRGKAVGVDGVTLEEYGKDLEKNLKELVEKMKP